MTIKIRYQQPNHSFNHLVTPATPLVRITSGWMRLQKLARNYKCDQNVYAKLSRGAMTEILPDRRSLVDITDSYWSTHNVIPHWPASTPLMIRILRTIQLFLAP